MNNFDGLHNQKNNFHSVQPYYPLLMGPKFLRKKKIRHHVFLCLFEKFFKIFLKIYYFFIQINFNK